MYKRQGVFTLPYIFTSTEQKYKVLDGEIGQRISDSLEKYNMISLGYWEAGSRNFYTTKKPITCVADMKGMKIRVQQSDIAIKMIETLGAAATPMSYNEMCIRDRYWHQYQCCMRICFQQPGFVLAVFLHYPGYRLQYLQCGRKAGGTEYPVSV